MNEAKVSTKTPAYKLAANKRWAQKNRGKWKEYENRWANKNPAKYILRTARYRAKNRGIPFDLTAEDIEVPSNCPVLGFPLVLGVGQSGRQGGNFNSPSLDRIIPEFGYIKGNVRVISHLANSMKGAATDEQLRRFAHWVLSQ